MAPTQNSQRGKWNDAIRRTDGAAVSKQLPTTANRSMSDNAAAGGNDSAGGCGKSSYKRCITPCMTAVEIDGLWGQLLPGGGAALDGCGGEGFAADEDSPGCTVGDHSQSPRTSTVEGSVAGLCLAELGRTGTCKGSSPHGSARDGGFQQLQGILIACHRDGLTAGLQADQQHIQIGQGCVDQDVGPYSRGCQLLRNNGVISNIAHHRRKHLARFGCGWCREGTEHRHLHQTAPCAVGAWPMPLPVVAPKAKLFLVRDPFTLTVPRLIEPLLQLPSASNMSWRVSEA